MLEKFFSELSVEDAHRVAKQNIIDVPKVLIEDELKEIPKEFHLIVAEEYVLNFHYAWRIGATADVHANPQHAHDGFPKWVQTLDSFGDRLLKIVEVVTKMIVIGFGLPKNAFTSLMHEGPHVLASSGCDLGMFGRRGMVLAEYHYDFNF